MAGRLLMEEVRRAGTEIIPIDSEHNAIFQCMPAGYLPGGAAPGVTRVILTASGRPVPVHRHGPAGARHAR